MGFVAFAVAGFFACLSEWPQKVFAKTFRLAWRAAFVGVVAGAVLGMLNSLIASHFLTGKMADPIIAFIGYMYGVTGGFIIGTFYGTIIGARREIARQKLEQPTPGFR